MSFLVSNHDGCFGLFGLKSRFQGVFFSHNNQVFKTLSHIDIAGEPNSISNELWRVSRDRGVVESFWFAHRLPVFFYELSSKKKFDLIFDCRLNFDNRVWGRLYDVEFVDKCFVLHYKKTNVPNESQGEEYDFWLALYGCSFEKLDVWEEQFYPFDKERNSPPFSRWVYRACRADNSFVMAFGNSRDDAVKLAVDSWKRKSVLADEAEKFSHIESVGEKEVRDAYCCSKYSLKCLRSGVGLFAGLPWFHQRWARDELVSLKSVDERSVVRSVLFDWLNKLLPGGKLPGTLTLTIADSGWLFVRFEDYLNLLCSNERSVLLERLEWYLSEVEKNLVDGLVVNGSRETWMDSVDRSGARIEVNCLVLAACRLYRLLNKEHRLEKHLKANVRKAFWKGYYLSDGKDDLTVRPNVFIAAYVYPELLSKKEWLKCFDFVLSRLWCPWGGLTTIDKTDSRFIAKHSGENSLSYHSGDSWYWLNNLSALVLHAFDKKYKFIVDSILKASMNDILFSGVVGHHAELSSANERSSEGCPVQAWSAALFCELVEEVSK